jgi:type II secretory pathway pseudopilin PulG
MKRRRRVTRREREGGFALLLVFVMAAVIGITLYMELPRLAFQSQRQKEQLLVERGQQYQIAIRRYMQRGLKAGVSVVAVPAWPSKIEDLEDTNGRRFLRKRYIDPLTGKDEWRIIHINNGILVDSINNKQQGNKDASSAPSGIGEFAGLGDVPTGASAANLGASRRRPSDAGGSGGAGSTGDPNQPTDPGNLAGTSPSPTGPPAPGNSLGTMPGMTPGMPPIVPSTPAQPQPGLNPTGSSGGFGTSSSFGSSTNPTGQPAYPGQIPGVPGVPGMPANSNYPGGVSPFPQPGTTPGQVSPANLINSLLTQPRPNGMPQVTAGNSGVIGGGIAGIASRVDADSIMVCGDHTNYQEWEFIFDPSKWRAPADPRKTVTGTPAGNLSPSSSNSSSSSMFGPGSGTAQPGGSSGPTAPTGSSGPGGTSPSGGPQPGANQGNFGKTCGMEARPGIQ